jgi:hypothetical protein
MIVSQPRELLWAWLNSRIGTPLSEDFRAVGLVRGGCIQAVAGYNAWVGKTCCFHGAIDNRAAIDRTYLRAIFEYPFDQCGMKAMLAVVSELNYSSLSFCERSGFRPIDTLSAAGLEGENMILLKLERLNCTWLRDRHGKEKRASSA